CWRGCMNDMSSTAVMEYRRLDAYNIMSLIFFFFSSRRRHTRLQGDWSSDVCSSDLKGHCGNPVSGVAVTFAASPGSGTVTPTTPVATGANGIAAATSWTLSATAGQNTATETATGLAGSPVTFTDRKSAGSGKRVVLSTRQAR